MFIRLIQFKLMLGKQLLIVGTITLLTLASCAPKNEKNFRHMRIEMVEKQIKSRGITDPRVISALLKVKRHLFVPQNLQSKAYKDHPLPIGQGQTISQPFIVAYMTQALDLKPTDRVLEIGTGSGYQAAILAELVEEVYTIEIVEPLARQAEIVLKNLQYSNIHITHGDGYQGLENQAPFDAIIVTAAPKEIPLKLVKQLAVGGKMIVPVGDDHQELILITQTAEGPIKKNLLAVKFVPMVKNQH